MQNHGNSKEPNSNSDNPELKKLIKLRMHLFQNITHELRTPLTLIKGPAAQLLNDGEIKGDSRQQLVRIYRNARRLGQLIEQILDLNRLENDSLTLSVQKVEIVAHLRQLVESFSGLIHAKQITFICDLPLSELWAYIDPDKFEKIISNLITNAAKFTPRGGQISLSLSDSDENITISIEDSGVGIKREKLNKIFDRFETGSSLDMVYREGLGIGLSLTKEYLELHKANILVESKEKVGTRFLITLKKGKSHLPDEIVTDQVFKTKESFIKEPVNLYTKKIGSGRRYQILLIEDNREMSNYITEVLAHRNYRIQHAYDGEEGLRMAKKYKPDLIISDILMPIMDGFQLLKHLRLEPDLKLTPTIFLTALTDIEDRLRGLRIGVNDYMVKPFNTDELVIRIQNLLAFREMRGEQLVPESDNEDSLHSLFGDDAFLRKLTNLIEKKMTEGSLFTDDIAYELNISRRTLYRKIKSLTGFTAAGFLKELRLQRARHMAETSRISNLKELAGSVGFSNSTYFRNEFVARFGKEPFE